MEWKRQVVSYRGLMRCSRLSTGSTLSRSTRRAPKRMDIQRGWLLGGVFGVGMRECVEVFW